MNPKMLLEGLKQNYPESTHPSEIKSNDLLRALKNVKLTDDQYEDLYNEILKKCDFFPKVSEIYSCYAALGIVRDAQPTGDDNLGWLYFVDKRGYSQAIRLMCVSGQWLNAPLSYLTNKGERVQLQKNPGMPYILPEGATDILICPDNPAKPDPSEMPENIEEVRRIMAGTEAPREKDHQSDFSFIGETLPLGGFPVIEAEWEDL